MRKTIIAALAASFVLVGGAGGWLGYRHFLRDPLAVARDQMKRGDLRSAQLELRSAVRRNPDNTEAHFRLGQVQLQFGDVVAAEKELKAARAGGWPDAQTVPPLARAYLAQERFVDLLRDFPPDKLPPEPMAAVLVSRSVAQIASHDGIAALASAGAAERLMPLSAEPPLAAARIAQALGDHGQALQKVNQALRLDPRLVEALGLKADILRKQGDLDQALVQLDAAVAVLPTAARVRLARARALLAAGDDAAAHADVDAALAVDPRSTLGLYLQSVLLIRLKDWPAADVSLQKIQPMLPQMPRGEYYYALVKSNVNQFEQAAEAAGHYVARNPGDPDGLRLLARIDLELGQQPAAAAALKRVADLGKAAPAGAEAALKSDAAGADASPEALTHTASLQIDAGDAGAAARDPEQAVERAPKRADGANRVIAALAVGDVAGATAALDRLGLQPNADPVVVGNLTGLVRMARLDFDGARAAWQDVVRAAPDAVPPRINLARVLALLGNAAEAEKLLTGTLESQPANRPALLALVEMRVAQGRAKDAVAVVQAARKAMPGLLGFLLSEAALRARAGDFAGAYGVLDEVPLEQAQSPALLTARAQILLAQGRGPDAADAWRQILLGNAGDAEARQRLIQLLMRMNQLPEALTLARDGLTRMPGNSELLQLVAVLTWRTAGLDAALAMADDAARQPVNLPTARLLKGGLYMVARRYPDAVAAYAAELPDAPFSALVIAHAAALRAAGRGDEATALLRDWIARQPDPIVAETLASLDIEARRLDDAESHLESVLAVRPTDAVALNNLAWVYQQKHNPKARDLAEKAYLLAPSPQTTDTLGWILTEQGNLPTGLLLLRRAATLLKNDPAVQYHLAAALRANGRHEAAAAVLTALLAKPGGFDEKPQALQLQAELAAVK